MDNVFELVYQFTNDEDLSKTITTFIKENCEQADDRKVLFIASCFELFGHCPVDWIEEA